MMVSDGVCYLLGALLLLVLPLDWLLCAAAAALVHELFHVLALVCLGGRVRKIRVSCRGCVIETQPMGDAAAFFSILAGPLGSFALLVFRRQYPRLAVCGAFQGLYNLLPVMPLDGGRILSLLLGRLWPHHARKILELTAVLTAAVTGIWLSALYFSGKAGISSVLFALFLILRPVAGKIPCKPARIKVE